MQLLKELAEYPDFINSVRPQNQKNFHKRMEDWELVLRFCALYHSGHNYTYRNFEGSISRIRYSL